MPESFKVLVKELQALCLDVRVLDAEGNQIELKNEDDDEDYQDSHEHGSYKADDEEIIASGYSIEDVDEEALGDEDFSCGDFEDDEEDELSLGDFGDEEEGE